MQPDNIQTTSLEPKINIIGNRIFTTSLDIAAKFEKEHRHVVRAIEALLSDDKSEADSDGCVPNLGHISDAELAEIADTDDSISDFHHRNFTAVTYTDSQNRSQRAYELTRDGFTLAAMAFTGKKVQIWKIQYINAFNRMEERLLKDVSHKQTSSSNSPFVAIAAARPMTRLLLVEEIIRDTGFLKPIPSRHTLIAMLNRGTLEGRLIYGAWHVYDDSLTAWLNTLGSSTTH